MAGRVVDGIADLLKTFPSILRLTTSAEAVLGLALLVVCVVLVLVALAGVAPGAERIFYVFAGLIALILVVSVFLLSKQKDIRSVAMDSSVQVIRYEAYIAAPMEGLILPDSGEDDDVDPEERYRNLNEQIKRVKESLRKECNIESSFYAGLDIDGPAKFDQPYIALEKAITTLLASRKFILIYPKRMSSSIVFEAGLALAHGKPSVWFVHDRSQLPYLMREADQASDHDGRRLVRILEYKDFDDLVRSFEVNGERLFEMPDKTNTD